MELSCVKINGANATIASTISRAMISEKVDAIAVKASKTVKMDGFRKGKVPLSAVKARYGAEFERDAKGDILRDMITKGLEEMSITADRLLGEPTVKKFDEADGEIAVELAIALRPEIVLGDFASVVPAVTLPVIDDAQVDERILDIAKNSLPPVKVEEARAVAMGDIAVIDFEGFVNEVPFDGGKADEFPLELGSGRFIPGFEDQVVGMSVGESRDVAVTFPENYGNSDLAAQPAFFKVTLKAIEAKVAPELNDDLAKTLLPNDEEATLEKVRGLVKEQLTAEAKNKLYNNELKPLLIEKLLEAITFDLPQSIVDQEVDLMTRSKISQMSTEDLEAIKADPSKVQAVREEAIPEAQKSVKATFMIDELARALEIDVDNNEIFQAIYYEAYNMGQDPKAVLDYYQQNNMMPAVKMAMLEDKLLTRLLDGAVAGA